MSKNIDPNAVRKLVAQLRGLEITEARATQLSVEITLVNKAARTEGVKNDFNAQPTAFLVTLERLSKR